MPRVPSKRFTYSSPLSLWIRSKLSFTILSKKNSLFFFSLISLSRHVEGNGLVSFTTALAARGLIDKEKVQDGDCTDTKTDRHIDRKTNTQSKVVSRGEDI